MTTKEEKTKLENINEILTDCIRELETIKFKARDASQAYQALDSLEVAEDRMQMLLLRFD